VARDLCFTGRRIDAEAAVGLGLVREVADDPVAAGVVLAEAIAANPRDVLVRTKAKAVRAATRPVTRTLDL
jgi:enoyl-CoA hydratase